MVDKSRKVDSKSRVVLPSNFADQLVTIESRGAEEVYIRLVKQPRKRPSLTNLLSGITEENIPSNENYKD